MEALHPDLTMDVEEKGHPKASQVSLEVEMETWSREIPVPKTGIQTPARLIQGYEGHWLFQQLLVPAG